jgi:hypothetical protein
MLPALLFLAFLPALLALYGGDDVVQLTEKDFDKSA